MYGHDLPSRGISWEMAIRNMVNSRVEGFLFLFSAESMPLQRGDREPSQEIIEDQNSQLKEKRDTAITLVAISLMFVFCQSIKLVADIYELAVCDFHKIQEDGHDPKCQMDTTIDTFISLGNLLCCINSAANFLLYMIRGKRFRDEFCKTYHISLSFQ